MSPQTQSPLSAFKKLMGIAASMLPRGFNSSKCKTEAKMATARIKLLRNKREVQVRQMRRDIAALLESGRDDTARIRVEHVIREQNTMAANEIIELFCELVVVRLPIIAKQRACPADLKEGIASLIYAAPRCSDIPELYRIRDIFEKKYGKDFVSAATDLRPDSGVNRMLIEKLSVRKPTGEVKLKIMKEIAKEYQIEWDTTESELELLKLPEELLEGPRSFSCATSIPVKSTPVQYAHPNDPKLREGSIMHFKDTASAAQAAAESAEKAVSAAQAAAFLAKKSSQELYQTTSAETPVYGLNNSNMTGGSRRQSLNSTASAAQAAAESAEKAVSAAQAVAFHAKKSSQELYQTTSAETLVYNSNITGGSRRQSLNSARPFVANEPSVDEFKSSGRVFDCQSFNMQNHMNDEDTNNILRSESYNEKLLHSRIKFDDSDESDSESNGYGLGVRSIGIYPPPNRLPPVRPPPVQPPKIDHLTERLHDNNHSPNTIAHVHPKLPDYESLATRFEALKLRRS